MICRTPLGLDDRTPLLGRSPCGWPGLNYHDLMPASRPRRRGGPFAPSPRFPLGWVGLPIDARRRRGVTHLRLVSEQGWWLVAEHIGEPGKLPGGDVTRHTGPLLVTPSRGTHVDTANLTDARLSLNPQVNSSRSSIDSAVPEMPGSASVRRHMARSA